MQIFGGNPLDQATQQLNGQKVWKKWDGELNHLPVFVFSSAWKNPFNSIKKPL